MIHVCKSQCSGRVRPFCTIGINDLGFEVCVECGSIFSKKAIIQNLKARFAQNWMIEFEKLKNLKRQVRMETRRLTRLGLSVAEVVYHNGYGDPKDHEKCLDRQKEDIKSAQTEKNLSLVKHTISSIPIHY